MKRLGHATRLLMLTIGLFGFSGSFLKSQDLEASTMLARIREESFERSQVMDFAWYLTDVIGPRLSGSSGMRRAQQWAKAKMDQIGLRNSEIEPWGEHGVNWDLEYVSVHMLEPSYQPIIAYPEAFTPGTPGKISGETVLVEIRGKQDLEKYRGKLRNAIVLSTPRRQYAPRFEPDAIRHDQGSLETFVEEGIDRNNEQRQSEPWMQNPPAREDLNATALADFFKSEGVAVVLEAARGGDGTVFVSGRSSHRSDRSLQSVEQSLPTLAVAVEHYNRIHRLVEHHIPVKLEIEVRVRAEERDSQEYNVLGEIPGGDLAQEIVMIGAHLDSWHSGTGATDNASGSAVVLEAMRILKALGVRPRRTIRVALWSMEEGGLRGSRAYVKKHFGNPRDGLQPDWDKLSVYFNMDNGTGRVRGVHQQGNKFAAPILSEWMRPFYDLRIGTLSNFSNRGSDQLSFDEAGLPGFQFIQDRIDYRTRTHHSNMDVYDKLIAEDLRINSAVLASFAYLASMADQRMPRKPFTDWRPQFEVVQQDLFGEGNSLTNAVADFDNDGDLDLFVGFNGKPNRLYRNDSGSFTDVAESVGLADNDVTRSAAWGDYDNDGNLDLMVGFVSARGSSNRLYRNQGNGSHFSDVTEAAGVALTGSFRQTSWIDYDRDGDVDLFLGFRDKPNVLFRNDGGHFTNVAGSLGLADPRRTVGAVWLDFDKDGDLDLVVANMDGDANGVFRNDGNRFVDIAEELGLSGGGRALGFPDYGTVRPSIVDFDGDGNLDLFFANYGPNGLFRNLGNSAFENVAPELGLAIDSEYDTAIWGDYDNDGRPDLYVNGTVSRDRNYRDYLFHNDAVRFPDITPDVLKKPLADHGAQWADMDNDGDLDLLLTGASNEGMHSLFRNSQSEERARRSLQIMVLDGQGHYTRAGSEVRLYDSEGTLLASRLVDTGSGYNSQNAAPVHFGVPWQGPVDVEVTVLTSQGRKSVRVSGVDPGSYQGRWLVLKVDERGRIRQEAPPGR